MYQHEKINYILKNNEFAALTPVKLTSFNLNSC